jgi:hypothetical protein
MLTYDTGRDQQTQYVMVGLHPVQYNPVRNEIAVVTKLKVKVHFEKQVEGLYRVSPADKHVASAGNDHPVGNGANLIIHAMQLEKAARLLREFHGLEHRRTRCRLRESASCIRQRKRLSLTLGGLPWRQP